ncbi:MAG TPA: hydroxysqualene dehydroxylase HpnE [Acidimicrobiales bacterium]|jgi:squalene-associated FAD-dependent desaturase|nr:hydroxysqualene dehydroxylase HpnE [Acidimicrobiales bacterium]
MSLGRLGVVGGGLAGIATALAAADAGAEVVLFERRGVLGGLTSSTERNGLWLDNGQHIFLRCCTSYLALLDRIGASEKVCLQDRMDVTVLSPSGTRSSLHRQRLPAPLHLGWSLATYRHLPARDRLGLARAALALRALDVTDPLLDSWTFGAWLQAKGQSTLAIDRLWDLIALPTINLPASQASLALAAKVFREGLLDRADSGDVGWSLVPLATLHGEHASRALADAGVTVRHGLPVLAVEPTFGSMGSVVRTADEDAAFEAVVVATPPSAAAALGVLDPETAHRLGSSPIVNIHLVFDRAVTDLAMFAAVDSPVQFVFDRTTSSGLRHGQCLALSLSAATAHMVEGSSTLVETFVAALGALLPDAGRAQLVDAVVTRERAATFRGVPGTAAWRPSTQTSTPGVFLAGAWCDTGWPATMEGAVRSGNEAARFALSWLTGAESRFESTLGSRP